MRTALSIALTLTALAVGVALGAHSDHAVRALRWAEHAVAQPVLPSPPPKVDMAPAFAPPVTVDAAAIPDPTPWPRVNAQASLRRAWLLSEGPARKLGDPHRLVTLTFDDGPSPEYTPTVLKMLARSHVRGTFFLIGRYLKGDHEFAKASREVAQKIVADGHLLGNHTHDHEVLTAVTHARVAEQIDESANAIEGAVGRRPLFLRPPYGLLDAYGESLVRDRGLELVLWSIEAEDMTRRDVDAMFDALRNQLEYAGGGIVLLHDARSTSVKLLARLLLWLKQQPWDPAHPEKKGYEVVDLAEYMRRTGERPQPYASRAELAQARALEWRTKHRGGDAPPPVPDVLPSSIPPPAQARVVGATIAARPRTKG